MQASLERFPSFPSVDPFGPIEPRFQVDVPAKPKSKFSKISKLFKSGSSKEFDSNDFAYLYFSRNFFHLEAFFDDSSIITHCNYDDSSTKASMLRYAHLYITQAYVFYAHAHPKKKRKNGDFVISMTHSIQAIDGLYSSKFGSISIRNDSSEKLYSMSHL